MDTEPVDRAVKALKELPPSYQELAVSYINSLANAVLSPSSRDSVAALAGQLPAEDAAVMQQMIDEEFGRIDWDGWPDLPRQ